MFTYQLNRKYRMDLRLYLCCSDWANITIMECKTSRADEEFKFPYILRPLLSTDGRILTISSCIVHFCHCNHRWKEKKTSQKKKGWPPVHSVFSFPNVQPIELHLKQTGDNQKLDLTPKDPHSLDRHCAQTSTPKNIAIYAVFARSGTGNGSFPDPDSILVREDLVSCFLAFRRFLLRAVFLLSIFTPKCLHTTMHPSSTRLTRSGESP